MVARSVLALGAAALAAFAVVRFAAFFRPGAVVPTAVVCGTIAAMAALPGEVRKRLGWSLLVPGVVSLTATAVVLATGTGVAEPASGTTVEVAGLLLIVIHVTRWDHGWSLPVVTAVTAAAQVLWLLRYMPGEPWSRLALACTFWGLGSAVAIAFGAYPRWAAARLRRTVASARAAQQRQLERDLHDYVAHDLSGMIVQAQAARYAAAGDAAALAAALQRIEEAGQRAMSSMDRALSLLRVHDTPSPDKPIRHPGLDDLEPLVRRFEQATSVPTDLIRQGDPVSVPREVGEVLYRACSEGLTNIHRHAGPAVTAVAVTLQVVPRAAGIVVVDESPGVVADDGPVDSAAPVRPRRGGGTGLADLRERVEALGGVLEAGPTPSGWRLAVRIPFTGAEST